MDRQARLAKLPRAAAKLVELLASDEEVLEAFSLSDDEIKALLPLNKAVAADLITSRDIETSLTVVRLVLGVGMEFGLMLAELADLMEDDDGKVQSS